MSDIQAPTIPELDGAIEKNRERLPTLRTIEIDFDRYAAILDDPELTEDQSEQIILALWSIVTSFLRLGFNIDPVQQACGQVENELDLARILDSPELKSVNAKRNVEGPSRRGSAKTGKSETCRK
ncbi:hypothetical protein [Roseibium sp. Sym1]|uniref:hypothetical protein n=1 Tax=Roseibium sp. Sym1 TaxID=3016006 RepID=UPI0022B5D7DC|nr:hypothetical protein [Roseibium sp. Sym1]